MTLSRSLLGASLAFPVAVLAQPSLPLKHMPEPTTAAVTAADLMTRLYLVADDSMMGRQAGTEGNLKATAYIAAEAERLGLQPAGDSGTFFQWIPLVRRTYASPAMLRVDGTPITSPRDWLPFGTRGTPRPVDGARVIFGGTFTDSTTWITAAQAAGHVVLFMTPRDAQGPLPIVPVIRGNSRFAGAAGVAVIGLERVTPAMMPALTRRTSGLRASAGSVASPQVFLVTNGTGALMLRRPLDRATAGDTGAVLHGSIAIEETPLPARNVVAVLPGRDPALGGEFVALGAHSDHIGIRDTPADHDSLRAFNAAAWEMGGRTGSGHAPSSAQLATIRVDVDSLRRLHAARIDSINNGADDDGSGTVALLEIAEAVATTRIHPRRSLLFVWHTGEELGLLGSRYFTDHPTVPRDSIVAQLNIDMIGRGGTADIARGGPRYLQVIGAFRLSTHLGQTAEQVNGARDQPFVFDYTLDAPGHPENIYCRSDHANYARYGIPIIFFSSGLHQDYHQVTDEPQYIDYAHLERITRYLFDLTLTLANQPQPPLVDHPKPDPAAPCRQ